ncbi:MAG: hypothetical protein NC429_09935 [Lachnospiraceae bacterium]|nr:hypothetical protein [Lachnospiraceae bacterium]
MENKKQRVLSVLWVLAAPITRILYFLFDSRTVVDTYGYYAHVTGMGGEPFLTSGMAYAYTNHLSKVLPYLEAGTEGIGLYHLILQVVWMMLLIAGTGILFGGAAQFLTGGILMVSPVILESIFIISPENYFMFCFSLLYFAFSLFFWLTKKRGWYRSSFGELYLMLTGFWMGVVCIWNYAGWLLLPIMIHILNKNRYNLKDKIWEQKQKDIYLERQQVMRVSSQSSILTAGILIGMYATLMKYTGITGDFLGQQIHWWVTQYGELPNRCQDLSTQLILWLASAGVIGILCSLLMRSARKRKLQNMMYEDEVYLKEEESGEADSEQKPAKKEKQKKEKQKKEKPKKEKQKKEKKEKPKKEKHKKEHSKKEHSGEEQPKEDPVKKEPQFVMTEDGRKVELLDNPLPVPPRHEKREMDFKLSEFPDESVSKEESWADMDEFDLKVSENDDFDV